MEDTLTSIAFPYNANSCLQIIYSTVGSRYLESRNLFEITEFKIARFDCSFSDCILDVLLMKLIDLFRLQVKYKGLIRPDLSWYIPFAVRILLTSIYHTQFI